MKRLIFLIWLLTIPMAWADYGHSIEGTNAEVNWVNDSALDSAWIVYTYNSSRYDSIKITPVYGTSSRFLSAFGLDLDSVGQHHVDIRGFTGDAWTDTLVGAWLHSDSVDARANLLAISDDATAADNQELFFDDTGFNATNSKIGTVTLIANNGITSGSLADDIHFDSMSFRTITIINISTNDPSLYIESDSAKGIHVYTDDDLGSPAVQFEEFGGGGYGFTVLGAGGDIYADLFGDIIGMAPSGINEFWEADSGTIDAGMGQMLKDTSAYQGAAGSLDAESVKDAVWGQTADTAFAAGSMGDSAKVWGRTGASGTGANTCSLWVYDTGNTVMVSDIKVRANNASGANQGMNRTNVTGIAVLNLDDGDYNLVIPMNSGYIQTTNPQPFTVSGATNDTIDVTWFSPSAPAGDLCTVYNYVKDVNDNGIRGIKITATIPTNFWPIRYQGQAVKATYTATTDGNGRWELPVYPSGLLLTADGDSASSYQFTAPGGLFGDMGHKVTVPDSASFFMIPDDEQ